MESDRVKPLRRKVLLWFALVGTLFIIVCCEHGSGSRIPYFEVGSGFEIQETYEIRQGAGLRTLANRYIVRNNKSDKPVNCILVDPNNEELLLYGFVEPHVNAEEYTGAVNDLYFVLFSEDAFSAKLERRYNTPNNANELVADSEIIPDIEISYKGKIYRAYYGKFCFHTDAFSTITSLNILKYDENYVSDSVYAAYGAENKIREYLDNILSACIGNKQDDSTYPSEEAAAKDDNELIKRELSYYLENFDKNGTFNGSELETVQIPCYEAIGTGLIPHRLYRMYGLAQDGVCRLIARVYYNEFIPCASIDINTETIADGCMNVERWGDGFSYFFFEDGVFLFDGEKLTNDWRLSIPMGEDAEHPEINRRTFPGRIAFESFVSEHGEPTRWKTEEKNRMKQQVNSK